MRSNVKMFGLCAGVLALMLTSQVSAAGKKGPRASVGSSTECALDLPGDGEAYLVVTTTLTNKSSGNTVPEVRNGSMIDGTYKEKNTRGRAFEILGKVLIEPVPQDVDPELTLTAEFQLCDGDDPREEVLRARELNGLSTINYGISGVDGETRTVTNRCTDDPLTLDDDEGAIKVDDATFTLIEAACLPITP